MTVWRQTCLSFSPLPNDIEVEMVPKARPRRSNVSIIRLAFFSPTHFSRSNGTTSPRPVLPRRRHKVDVVSSYISTRSAQLKSCFPQTLGLHSSQWAKRKIPQTLTPGSHLLYLVTFFHSSRIELVNNSKRLVNRMPGQTS